MTSLFASALFLGTFAFYLAGLCGTVPSYRDSGDLIASVANLGVAHPPGYPLYVILGNLLGRLVPFATWAYRVNILSAACAAGSVAVLFLALKRLGSKNLTPAVTALFFATTPAVVALARVSEMYALGALMAAMILYALFSDHPRGILLASFLLGLGLGAHPTLIFLAPLFVMAHRGIGASEPRGKVFSPMLRRSGSLILFFLLGVSIFAFLPIRAAQSPWQNWGDPSHWRNFWRVVTRADYGGFKLHPEQSHLRWTGEDLLGQLGYFVRYVSEEWTLVGALMGVASWIFLVSKRRLNSPPPWGLLGAWVLVGPAFFVLSNLPLHETTTPAILQPYLLLNNLLWAVVVACGIQQFPMKALLMAALVAVSVQRVMGLPSQRRDFYTYDYGRNLLRSLPQGAVLYDPDDPTAFTIRALQVTEGRRQDVVLLNFFRTRWGYEQIRRRWPDLLPPVPLENSQALQASLWNYSVKQRPFYVELPQKLRGVPYHAEGLVYRVKDADPNSLDRAESHLALYVTRGDFHTPSHPDFFTSHLIGYYAAAHSNLGLDYAARHDWTEAVNHYKKALVIDPGLSPAYNNWGIVEFERRQYAAAIRLYEKAIQLEPANEGFRGNLAMVYEISKTHLK